RQAREAARAKLRVADNGVAPAAGAAPAHPAQDGPAGQAAQAQAAGDGAEVAATTPAPEAAAPAPKAAGTGTEPEASGAPPNEPAAPPEPSSRAGGAERADAPPAAFRGVRLERDPARVFEPLSVEAPYLGGLLLDSRGLVLAGSFRTDDIERGETLGAVIGAAAEEAVRTAELLSIGAWNGILMETDRALLHVAPLERDLVVLTAAERGTPVGWVLRTARHATELARRFLEGRP